MRLKATPYVRPNVLVGGHMVFTGVPRRRGRHQQAHDHKVCFRDNSLSSDLQPFEDLWGLEDNGIIAPAPNSRENLTKPCEDQLDFTTYLEQGVSAETLFSIDNGIEESNLINYQQDGSLSTLLEAYNDPYMFAEQENNIFQNNNSLEMQTYFEQEKFTVADLSNGEGRSLGKGSSCSKTIMEKNSNVKYLASKERVLPNDVQGGLPAILAKRQDHNSKERVRRMNLRASYAALGSLLPQSRRSKKRWTAPVIIDKVLEYIPKLQKHIQELNLKKNGMVSMAENNHLFVNRNTDSEGEAALTVSVNEIKMGELILQICRKRDGSNVFSNLLESIEDEGICIVSASTIHVCEERECYHIHIQMKVKESSSSSNGGDYVAVLKENVISWLS